MNKVWDTSVPNGPQTLNDGDIVRVVIKEAGIDADYRVVVEPDLEQDDVWHYSLKPLRDA